MEGHISHCGRVLQRYHSEQSSFPGEFGCRSFIKHRLEQFVFYLSCEILAYFCEPRLGRISLKISLSDSVLEYSRSREKHSTTSRVSPTLLSCSSRFLRALQQNRVQSRLFYLLNQTQQQEVNTFKNFQFNA